VNILVADDDPISLLITQMALQRLGHECQTAVDGARAWEAFKASAPEVVISDWIMPGMTGLELCRRIRGRTPEGYTYFVMVTGQGSLEEILEGMSAGADDYLVKPLDPDDLEARLIPAARVTSLHRRLASQQSELKQLNDELTAIARRDPLTKLGNRRALGEDLTLLEARVARYGHRYCMALLDVDHFKAYNDTYGHLAGDDVLQAVAAELEAEARAGDGLYRYGGEEFLCIFPEQSLEQGTKAVERMRRGLEGLAIPHAANRRGVLTLSAGLAMLEPEQGGLVWVLEQADQALYRAKRQGRNRIEQATARVA